MPSSTELCPIPGSRERLEKLVAEFAKLTDGMPGVIVSTGAYRQPAEPYLVMVGTSTDFADVTGVPFIRLKRRLRAAGFKCDHFAHMDQGVALSWGARVWGLSGAPGEDAELVRGVLRECGFECLF